MDTATLVDASPVAVSSPTYSASGSSVLQKQHAAPSTFAPASQQRSPPPASSQLRPPTATPICATSTSTILMELGLAGTAMVDPPLMGTVTTDSISSDPSPLIAAAAAASAAGLAPPSASSSAMLMANSNANREYNQLLIQQHQQQQHQQQQQQQQLLIAGAPSSSGRSQPQGTPSPPLSATTTTTTTTAAPFQHQLLQSTTAFNNSATSFMADALASVGGSTASFGGDPAGEQLVDPTTMLLAQQLNLATSHPQVVAQMQVLQPAERERYLKQLTSWVEQQVLQQLLVQQAQQTDQIEQQMQAQVASMPSSNPSAGAAALRASLNKRKANAMAISDAELDFAQFGAVSQLLSPTTTASTSIASVSPGGRTASSLTSTASLSPASAASIYAMTQSGFPGDDPASLFGDALSGSGLHSGSGSDSDTKAPKSASKQGKVAKSHQQQRSALDELDELSDLDAYLEDDESNFGAPFSATNSKAAANSRKRISHIASEQRRRNGIKLAFEHLRDQVPSCRPHDAKAMILRKAADYISALKKERTDRGEVDDTTELRKRVKFATDFIASLTKQKAQLKDQLDQSQIRISALENALASGIAGDRLESRKRHISAGPSGEPSNQWPTLDDGASAMSGYGASNGIAGSRNSQPPRPFMSTSVRLMCLCALFTFSVYTPQIVAHVNQMQGSFDAPNAGSGRTLQSFEVDSDQMARMTSFFWLVIRGIMFSLAIFGGWITAIEPFSSVTPNSRVFTVAREARKAGRKTLLQLGQPAIAERHLLSALNHFGARPPPATEFGLICGIIIEALKQVTHMLFFGQWLARYAVRHSGSAVVTAEVAKTYLLLNQLHFADVHDLPLEAWYYVLRAINLAESVEPSQTLIKAYGNLAFMCGFRMPKSWMGFAIQYIALPYHFRSVRIHSGIKCSTKTNGYLRVLRAWGDVALGDFSAGDRRLGRAAANFEQSGLPNMAWQIKAFHAVMHIMQGRFTVAKRFCQESLVSKEPDQQLQLWWRSLLQCVASAHDESFDAWKATFEQLVSEETEATKLSWRESGLLRSVLTNSLLAWMHFRQGEHDTSVEFAIKAIDYMRGTKPISAGAAFVGHSLVGQALLSMWVRYETALSENAAPSIGGGILPSPRVDETAPERTVPIPDQFKRIQDLTVANNELVCNISRTFPGVKPLADYLVGRTHRVRGQNDKATRKLRDALYYADRFDMPFDKALIQLELAQLDPSLDEGIAYVQSAREQFVEVGALYEVRLADELHASLRQRHQKAGL
ncbi:hypothetical protein CAOG_00228 [Capsaspora owczarzaki ATCC 30864]|uniref:BHLH domain-containing protein n=1 Tax=Capsaspora owczarzaki (strain ATCC 30864) TaxID=595528 RepID=A0A0D2VFT2_CAPO3|nr:hypothetical protein CAOG_00228 [Capsaspora owczarzaki ATCC 30864]KJE88597.1 hypothetical protein CAOG_000228 [Capsaspora owczarzaki ATCC 30864]|eukprot:XP_004365099.1 hypothetical protein CAOG_00228 [Capsaspora owczarzaki ATCC 30864]